ncbi:cytochrome-c peroxidase [Agarilytica rhodophyticola]|uniref:cytochrome-c peroxidase n=1 Tax=Agarilytica rhodophyticola TaxID=1737490 RepID=UPI000B348BBB|nr:cytochrome c peroxidase [Agarilytica rhodophyticola]
MASKTKKLGLVSLALCIGLSLNINVNAATPHKKSNFFRYNGGISKTDILLRKKLRFHDVKSVEKPAPQDPAMVELGQSLFFDKELSGRRNIDCETCHSPFLGSADGQSQSRAQGAIGLGPSRRQNGDERFDFLPRNALSLWNRGVPGWDVMFWDGRLSGNAQEGFISPAGDDTPQNFTNALGAFSAFPITPDEEMRGFPGQLDVFGQPNELGDLTDEDFVEIWDLITARIVNNEGYDELLDAAFPGVEQKDLDIADLSNAMGAFMTEAFTALDSPFDRYLAGDNSAMSDSAKRGALLFYGRANCAACHSGGLQTDFEFHNIAAPQVGTGRGDAAPLDLGRGAITGNPSENFQFRTPSLRNIELEGPYMHNGAFDELEDAIRHHLDPFTSLATYDASQIEFELAGIFQNDPQTLETILSTLDPELVVYGRPLNDNEIKDLMSFMSALTDPASLNLFEIIPTSVASGLPLAD